jgi:hypothetical protein
MPGFPQAGFYTACYRRSFFIRVPEKKQGKFALQNSGDPLTLPMKQVKI